MPFKKHGRQYDLVVFGATGYTGKLTCQYIAERFPSNLKWAVAGRSESKLQAIVDDCRGHNPDRIQPLIEICNLSDEDLSTLTKKTFVLITTVGPYGKYGHHAYKACAENGTHYLDVTGEVAFTARMVAKYDSVAKASGAIMISQVGVESAPSDICTWALARTLRDELHAQTGEVTLSVKLSAKPSGGTLASALGLFDNFSLKEIKDTHRPFALSPVPNTYKPPRRPRSWWTLLTGLRQHPDLGLSTTSIANRTDGSIVERTWGLLSATPSRKAEFYGPRFRWVQYMSAKDPRHGMSLHVSLVVFGFLLVAVPPFRWLMKKFVYQPGEGPDLEEAKKDVIEYRGVARPDEEDEMRDGVREQKRAWCRARFQGSMYYFTGVLVSQAALTILEEDLELPGGSYTPACLGAEYVDRLAKGGFNIETKVLE